MRINLKSFKLQIDGEIDSDKGRGLSKIKTTYFIETDSDEKKINKFVDLVERYCTIETTILNAPEFENEVNIIR